jgi:hypothetical protein
VPVGVFAAARLNTKFDLGNLLNGTIRCMVSLVQRAKFCICRRAERAPSGREMHTETERCIDADDLKRSLIA